MNKLKQEYFFCYDRKVMLYLKGEGFKFITSALHETTYNKFWLFVRSPELDKALSMKISS